MSVRLALLLVIVVCEVLHAQVRRSLYRSTYSKYEGDVYLAAMFSLHHYNGSRGCGRIIDQDGLQVITAAVYALEQVKASLHLPLRIGLLSIDTCQDPDYGVQQSRDFMLFKSCQTSEMYSCEDGSSPNVKMEYRNLQRIFGVFGAGNSDVSIMAATFLRLVDLPQISYFSTSPELSDHSKYPDFFRTIPSDLYTVQAIAALLRRYNLTFVLVVSDDSKYSTATKDSFKSFISSEGLICVYDYVKITRLNSYTNLSSVIQQIYDNTTKEQTPKVVVTFLTQVVVEELLNYVEMNPVQEFRQLQWIGTDSWGGRTWPNITRTNCLMNNSMSVIPRASKMDAFMDYYKRRLPSVDDYNPWMAQRFEEVCQCQYSNDSMFIFPELLKLRRQINGSRPCEPIEEDCGKRVFRDSVQMPYIHYVMDGILAYGNTVRSLIGRQCDRLNYSECSQSIWKNGSLNYLQVVQELRTINFTDSTNETFHFWKGREGVPSYSVLYFNTSTEVWEIAGSITDYNESTSKFKLSISESLDFHFTTRNIITPCSEPCKSGYSRSYVNNKCCWKCVKCSQTQFIYKSVSDANEKCQDCQVGYRANINSTACQPYDPTFMSLDDMGAMIIFMADLFGLLYCVFVFVSMVVFWSTPIMKAFGKETSFIILLGTVLSFTLSMSLLGKPSHIRCGLFWFAPGFCSTICYASILAKTNRIARIFGMNWSSKTKASPKFVSPVSQMTIIGAITLLEACILILIILFGNVTVHQREYTLKVELECMKMDAGNLVATFLIPILLLVASTFYAFKMRKTPDGFNETRNINFMNFANCVVLVTSLFLYQLLSSYDAVYPLCLQMTLSAYSNLIGLFTPKIYLVICRPERNTMECVTARSRTRSQMSLTQPNTPMADINLIANIGNARCRKCNTLIHDSLSSYQLTPQTGSTSARKSTSSKSPTKVFFVEEDPFKLDSKERVNTNIGRSNFAYEDDN